MTAICMPLFLIFSSWESLKNISSDFEIKESPDGKNYSLELSIGGIKATGEIMLNDKKPGYL
jgi:hypothetical protein